MGEIPAALDDRGRRHRLGHPQDPALRQGHDRRPATNLPVKVTLAAELPERAPQAKIIDPVNGATRTVTRDELVNTPDTKTVIVKDPAAGGEPIKRKLLALDLSDDLKRVERFLVETPDEQGRVGRAGPRASNTSSACPIRWSTRAWSRWSARRSAISCSPAIMLFPLTYLLTGFRWHLLLKAVDIHDRPAARVRHQHGRGVLQHVPPRLDRRRRDQSRLRRPPRTQPSHPRRDDRPDRPHHRPARLDHPRRLDGRVPRALVAPTRTTRSPAAAPGRDRRRWRSSR